MAAPDPRATLLTRQNDAADRELDEVSTASEPREVDLALRRYDIVFRYLATENQMSWTKNQFFLAANGGLLAFAPSRFPKDATWPSLLVRLSLRLPDYCSLSYGCPLYAGQRFTSITGRRFAGIWSRQLLEPTRRCEADRRPECGK